MNRKPESSRLNLFYILHVLSEYSDEQNPMSAQDIADMVNREFNYLSESGSVISMDTVKRTLDELTDKIFAEGTDYFAGLQRYGMFVHTVMNTGGVYKPYRDKEGRQGTKKYYYLENELQDPELITLKDSIEAYCYFSEDDTTEIIRKLLRFAPQKMKNTAYFDKAGNDRTADSRLLMKIDYLAQIIREHKGAKITYCSYDIDKKLIPRPGYPKVVEPVDMMWSNGFYYLLAYSEKYEEIMNLRIDRITNIEEAELENRHSEEAFNPVRYRHEHPVMFTGPEGRAKLLCRNRNNNYMMNILMDAFGKNARIHRASDKLVRQYLGKGIDEYEKEGVTWLEVTVDSSLWGIELWAMQYCKDCRLIAPEESVNRVRGYLREAEELYKET